MTSFLNGVRGVFRRHPFLANSAIYGSLYVAAEYSQQYLVKRVLVNEFFLTFFVVVIYII